MEIDVDVAIGGTETTGGSTQSKGGVDNRLQVVCAYRRFSLLFSIILSVPCWMNITFPASHR